MFTAERLPSPEAMDIDETSTRPGTNMLHTAKWMACQKLIGTGASSETSAICNRSAEFSSHNASGAPASVDISSVAYEKSAGKLLAVGDSRGNIRVFTKDNTAYKQSASFVSHTRDFDYLRSLEIEENVNKIAWCPSPNDSHFLLSTNDKTVKLWKIDGLNDDNTSESHSDDIIGPPLPAPSVVPGDNTSSSSAAAYSALPP